MMVRLKLVTLAIVILLGGCRSDAQKPLDLGSADANQIGQLIDEINEAKGNPKKLAALWAGNSQVPDARKLNAFDYSLGGRPRVHGDTATCAVRIDDSRTGETTQKEWSFVKQGNEWKIQNAPLP
jgi:hypothetical protein